MAKKKEAGNFRLVLQIFFFLLIAMISITIESVRQQRTNPTRILLQDSSLFP